MKLWQHILIGAGISFFGWFMADAGIGNQDIWLAPFFGGPIYIVFHLLVWLKPYITDTTSQAYTRGQIRHWKLLKEEGVLSEAEYQEKLQSLK